MSGVIACIWLKAMCTIWKDSRKKKKEKAGGQADAAVASSVEKTVPGGANGNEEQLSTFSSRNPMANTSDDDDNSTSSSSAPPPLDLARMANIMAAGQDTIIIIILMYPGVSGHAMQFFRCRKINGVEYMMVDYSLHCYDGSWYGMLVLVALVLIFLAVGSPVLMAWLLYKKRDKIKDEAKADAEEEKAKAARALLPGAGGDDAEEDGGGEEKNADGDETETEKKPPADPLTILYKMYRPEVYYYEPIKMVFKLALWFALVLFDDGSEMQLGLALIINTFQLVVHIYLLPLRGSPETPAWQLNMLETGSLVVICFLNFGAFTINFQRVSLKAFPKRADDISRNIEVLKGLMQFLTFAQFGALLYKMLRTQWLKRHDTAAGIADKFNKLKMRAPKIGGRLRPRSKSGSIDSGGDLEAAATVVSGDDGAASSTEEAKDNAVEMTARAIVDEKKMDEVEV